jgi:multidrug resistance efflux pump
MANTMTLEFAGDAEKLKKAAAQSDKALSDVGKSATQSSQDMEKSSKSSGDLLDKFSKLGNAVGGAGDAIDQASGLLDDWNQIQSQSYEKTQHNERALNDVRQAQEDYNQAIRDGNQSTIDAGQAQVDKQQADLDAATALKQYNADVKEHGKGSSEAKQDLIDLKQARLDATQADEDGAQAIRDASQATIDAKGAQLDLNDAQREANPPDSSKLISQLQTYTPLISGLIGITGLVTAAQWAWNAAQLASPTTWIVAGIIALVAGIVLLVKNWDKVKAAGEAAWGGIQKAGSKAWSFIRKIPGELKSAFSGIGNDLLAPFRWAFNHISDAWNNTVGRLQWSIPSWVPGIGGASIGAPRLPHFHTGGVVPGPAGSEVPIMALAGETVGSLTDGGGGDLAHVSVIIDGDVLIEAVSRLVRRRGGSAQEVLGGANA